MLWKHWVTIDLQASMDIKEARDLVERLTLGTPPSGHLRNFTVGRTSQLKQLVSSLDSSVTTPEALLVQANYGAGKTHLLRLLRETALGNGFAVAYVVVDAQGGLRFNRMDQVVSAVFRGIEIPGNPKPGIGSFFDHFLSVDLESLNSVDRATRSSILTSGTWARPLLGHSTPLWIALRAWAYSNHFEAKQTVIQWLSHTWDFESRKSFLTTRLVKPIPRSIVVTDWGGDLYGWKSFSFRQDQYNNSWRALNDLDQLCRLSGLRGLVLLFDEFEDVIQNLRNIAYEQASFQNLLRLMDNSQFSGWKYFAVTPEFATKCRNRLREKQIYDFPVKHFDDLPRIKMDPVDHKEFFLLAQRIREVHAVAFQLDTSEIITDEKIRSFISGHFEVRKPDQIRTAVTGFLALLNSQI